MTSTPAPADNIIDALTEEQIQALMAQISQEVNKETKIAKAKKFLVRHQTALAVTASALLTGAAFVVASKHQDELHDVIDALPEVE